MGDKVLTIDATSERIKETSSPTMYQDFYDEIRPLSKIYGYRNDFSTFVADEWTVTEVGTSTQNILDARNGVLSLISGGTENDGTQLQLGGSADGETTGMSFIPVSGKNIWFECNIASPAWTQHEAFVGLHVQDTSVAESKGSDYIGFIKADGVAFLSASTSANSVVTTATSVFTPTDSATTFVKLGFKVTSLDKVEFYVNDILVSTITTTIPTTGMKLSIAHTAGEAVSKTLNIDFVQCYQDR